MEKGKLQKRMDSARADRQARQMFMRANATTILTLIGVIFTITGALQLLPSFTDTLNVLSFIPIISFAVVAVIVIAGYVVWTMTVTYHQKKVQTTILSKVNHDLRRQLVCGPKEAADGYEIRVFRFLDRTGIAQEEYYVQSDLVDRALSGGAHIPMEEKHRAFMIPNEVKPYVPAILGKIIDKNKKTIFNSELLRQSTHLGLEKRGDGMVKFEPVMVQKTDYFAGQCTHETVYHEYSDDTTLAENFKGSRFLCAQVEGAQVLLDMTQSHCANFLGASTLVITKDQKMILGQQGAASMANARRYAPSGSGSVDYADVKHAAKRFAKKLREEERKLSLDDVVIYAMEREFFEESYNEAQYDQIRSSIIGYVRLLERGGKPDFFGVSYVNRTYDEIVEAGNQKRTKLFKQKKNDKEAGLSERMIPLEFSKIEEIPEVLNRFCEEKKKDGMLSIQVQLIANLLTAMQTNGNLKDCLTALGVSEAK